MHSTTGRGKGCQSLDSDVLANKKSASVHQLDLRLGCHKDARMRVDTDGVLGSHRRTSTPKQSPTKQNIVAIYNSGETAASYVIDFTVAWSFGEPHLLPHLSVSLAHIESIQPGQIIRIEG